MLDGVSEEFDKLDCGSFINTCEFLKDIHVLDVGVIVSSLKVLRQEQGKRFYVDGLGMHVHVKNGAYVVAEMLNIVIAKQLKFFSPKDTTNVVEKLLSLTPDDPARIMLDLSARTLQNIWRL